MKRWVVIVAAGEKGLIGNGKNLPWNIEKEKKFFREVTSGKILIVGRKTFESFKEINQKTKYIILSRDNKYSINHNNCTVVSNIEWVKNKYKNEEIWICGGKEIYNQFWNECDEIIISEIYGDYKGDVYLDIDLEQFEMMEEIQKNETFITKKYIHKLNRFKDINETKEAYRRYVEGAINGVVGHHVNYPIVYKNNSCIERMLSRIKENKNEIANIYIHWPFCCLPLNKDKCDFCMCNTKNNPKDIALKDKYFDCLLKELDMYAEHVKNKKIGNVYLGGGTPMSMPNEMLHTLLSSITEKFNVSEETLISLEARPEMLIESKINILVENNVKKVSLGVENFNDEMAYKMGRTPRIQNYYKVVERGVDNLRKKGIEYINIDLIYGHPEEKEEDIDESIKKVINLKPDSIAYYAMGLPYGCTNIEKNEKYEDKWKSIEYRINQANKIEKELEYNGYQHIVESIWALNDDGKKTIYEYTNGLNNTCYAPMGIWLGIGIGSIGFIEDFGQIVNINDVEKYIDRINNQSLSVEKIEELSIEESMRNNIVLGILHGKIDRRRFIEKYGKSPEELFKKEFEVMKDDIEILEEDIILKKESINRMEGLCRLFFSKTEEDEYRKREKNRIDYKYYGIKYDDIK